MAFRQSYGISAELWHFGRILAFRQNFGILAFWLFKTKCQNYFGFGKCHNILDSANIYDPDNRPTAEEVLKTIAFWKDIEILKKNKPNNYSKEQLDELEKIRENFYKMDKIKYDPSTIPGTIHPNAIYTSRILKFTNLPRSINSNKVTII